MDCSTPGFLLRHYLPKFAQTGPSSQWCHPTISSSVNPFSYPQSFPASGSFPMRQPFTSNGHSIRASVSAPGLPMNIQSWLPLGLTSLISLTSKGLSRVFSSTTVWKHEFFSSWSSLESKSHIHTWLLEKPLTLWTFVSIVMSLLFNTLSRFVITFLLRNKCLLFPQEASR